MTPLTYEEWQEMEDIKRETQRQCRHRRSRAVYQTLVIERDVGEWVANGVEKRVCTRCWAWLPLGPSNETDERVAVEIRAAEIAARLADFHALTNWYMGNDEFVSFTQFEERRGWSIAESNMQNHSDAWLSGYLARCIQAHTDGEAE